MATPSSAAPPPAGWLGAGEGAAGTSAAAAGWHVVVGAAGPWRGEEGAVEAEGACVLGAAS